MGWPRFALMTIAGLAAAIAATARAEETTGSIRGTVTIVGNPLPKAQVVLHSGSGKAISGRVRGGAFTFEKLPAGTLRVSVTGEGVPRRYADPGTSGLPVRVKAGSSQVRLDLNFPTRERVGLPSWRLTLLTSCAIIPRMIRSFRDAETERLFLRERRTKLDRTLARAALRKLLMLDAAVTLDDLRIAPENRLEKLSRDREGQYRIRINDRWRVCFQWEDGDAHEVEIVDYH
jgi:toxin HigB-1